MEFGKQRFSVAEARELDMVDYLRSLGHEPVRIRGNDFWYRSPLRNEKTASFRVNRETNRWKDWGDGQTGDLIDFAIRYGNCTIGEFLGSLSQASFSFQRHDIREAVLEDLEPKMTITREGALYSYALLNYIRERRIAMDVADRYCREVWYKVEGRSYYAIGFKNDAGGFELRNPYYKSSSSPKTITTFDHRSAAVSVFEGFFDFLTFLTIHKDTKVEPMDFLVLNSLSFFDQARVFMEAHDVVHLYLDRDTAGRDCTSYALSLGKCYRDESFLYKRYKDLNDWHVHIGKAA